MSLEDQLQQYISECLNDAGLDNFLPSFTEYEAIDYLSCAIQNDDSQRNVTDAREAALIFKAMIDLLRLRKHTGISFHRQHMY